MYIYIILICAIYLYIIIFIGNYISYFITCIRLIAVELFKIKIHVLFVIAYVCVFNITVMVIV